MAQLLLVHALAAVLAPVLVGRLGRRAFLLLAAVPGAAAVWAATVTGRVLAGDDQAQVIRWVDSLQMHFEFRLDTLSWVMTLLVGGIGALVLVYSSAYFSASARALGRFAGVFVGFAGAMLGLVTTDNTLALYMFWELTTVFSYLLIGHYHERQSSRRAANQAIVVTTLGGLAMLAGFVALGEMPGGSYRLSVLVERAAAGALGAGGPLLSVAVVLVLVGALSKSALVPFHFWLPAAMAAPTPVSAYLHAAAMVKAGVYLVARLAPGFSGLEAWRFVVLAFGLATLLLGGYRALRQHDLKLVLAFGTVSQLGMMIAMVGYGSRAVALGGLALVVSHALFKACLFLVVGVIDWAVGTRDMRELSGLRRTMPGMALTAGIATGSMIGVPPLAGYVAKEAALEGLVSGSDWLVLALLALGSALTVAYGLRFWLGAFSDKPGLHPSTVRYRSRLIAVAPATLAVLSVAVGLVPAQEELLLAGHANHLPGGAGHLTLWGGFTPAFFTTVAVFAAGLLLFRFRAQVERAQSRAAIRASADDAYRHTVRNLENLAADVTAATQRGSLPLYLASILVVLIATIGGSALVGGTLPGAVRGADWWGQVLIAAFIALTAVLAARARRRLKAVLLLGASGYGMALLFATHGAPDLALTQVMVETVSLVLFVLVLRRLPAYFSNRPQTRDRFWRMALGAAVGLTAAVAGMMAVSGRVATPISAVLPQATLEYGYGKNIVNVILVDTRAWDTMGEISVVLVAATGVASLLFLRDRGGIVDFARNRLSASSSRSVWDDGGADVAADLRVSAEDAPPRTEPLLAPSRNQPWLRAVTTLAPRRRSVIFEIGTRLVFHSMILFSLYLLFAGHNQPGGGFSGGLMAGTALIVRYLAGGRYELGEAMPVHAGYLLGAGLTIATGAALLPVFFGGQVLQTAVFELALPLWGEVKIATALLFDMGVYTVVIGLVLDVLRSLGAEVDRHGEIEGLEDSTEEEDDDEGQVLAPAAPRAGRPSRGRRKR